MGSGLGVVQLVDLRRTLHRRLEDVPFNFLELPSDADENVPFSLAGSVIVQTGVRIPQTEQRVFTRVLDRVDVEPGLAVVSSWYPCTTALLNSISDVVKKW